MNNKGNFTVGVALLLLAVFFIMTLNGLIEPFKETLDNARDTTSLNCPGTLTFNQTDFDDDTPIQKLTRRPTCVVTGIGLFWFYMAFIIAVISWLIKNWSRTK
jgi:hypothetical protein